MKCPNCNGTGKSFYTHEVLHTLRWMPCQQCRGTGIAGREVLDDKFLLDPEIPVDKKLRVMFHYGKGALLAGLIVLIILLIIFFYFKK